jgi:antitoxin YefM
VLSNSIRCTTSIETSAVFAEVAQFVATSCAKAEIEGQGQSDHERYDPGLFTTPLPSFVAIPSETDRLPSHETGSQFRPMHGSSNGTKTMRLAEDIVPIAEFKAHLSQVVRDLRDRGRPMVITQNGKPAAVLLSPEDFDQLTYQSRVVASVNEGLKDLEAGRVLSHAHVGKVLDERFGQRKVKPEAAPVKLRMRSAKSKTNKRKRAGAQPTTSKPRVGR